MSKFAKIVCVDFDGVIHSYEKGWHDGLIYGSVVPGFFGWAMDMEQHGFQLVIYSSRSKSREGQDVMRLWLNRQIKEWREASGNTDHEFAFEYAHEKPAAWVTIDDRAIRFKGDWNAPKLSPQSINDFRSWVSKT